MVPLDTRPVTKALLARRDDRHLMKNMPFCRLTAAERGLK